MFTAHLQCLQYVKYIIYHMFTTYVYYMFKYIYFPTLTHIQSDKILAITSNGLSS